MYEAFRARLAAELIRKFGRNIGDDTFCTDILSEYNKNINYFSKKYSHDLTSLSALEKEKNTLKLNSLSEVKVNDKTIKNFLKPFLDNPENNPEQHENINKQLKKNGPHTKTLDYLSVSLGYFGWLNFRRKKKEIIPDIITSDKKIEVKEDMETVVEKHIELSNSITSYISGTTIIDESFVEKIENENTTSRFDFYTARQNSFCQWIGVIKGYDVERNAYSSIRKMVFKSFEKNKDFKVSAVVLGDGGSGKSTLLRRLAIDLRKNQPFTVLWLDKGSLKEFVEKGMKTIQKNQSENYLLIIEDWYRNVGNDTINAKILLEKATELSNFRICIGDRVNNENLYWKYLSDHNQSTFTLSSDENQMIIDKVVKDYPEWKTVADALLSNNCHKSSLFMLLFIIAHVQSSDNKNLDIDLSEPQTVFVNIIKSDLNNIRKSKNYNGLAQALYYTAYLYKEYKVPITYEAFLKFADFFQGTSEISTYFLNRNLEGNKTIDLVQKYISLKNSPGRNFIYLSGDEEWVHFNHDIFFELGLTQILFDDWEEYGEIIKAKMMNLIIEQDLWWRDYIITDKLCNDEKLIQQNKKLFFKYVDVLFKNYGSPDSSIMNLLQLLNLTHSELLEYTKRVIESFSLSSLFGEDEEKLLTEFFSHYKNKFKEIYDNLFSDCLSLYSEKGSDDKNSNSRRHFHLLNFLIQEEGGKQKLYHKILNYSSFLTLDGSIINTCLKGLSDKSKANTIANSILLQPKAYSLNPYIISAALDCADQKNIENFTDHVFKNCFQETKKETLIYLINKMNKNEYLLPFVDHFFYKNNNPDNIEVQDFQKIKPIVDQQLFKLTLESSTWEKLIPEILLLAFQETTSLELKISITNKISGNLEWMKENLNILFHFWTFSKDIKIESYILEHWTHLPINQLFKILNNYKNKNIPLHIKKYVSEVIQNYHSTKSKVFHFGDLFLLDLQNIQEIQNEIQALLSNWQSYDRSIVAKFICSDYIPDDSKYQIGKSILAEWKNELKIIGDIDEKIRQYKKLFYGSSGPIASALRVITTERWIDEDDAAYYSIYCRRYLFEIGLFHPVMKEEAKKLLTSVANQIHEATSSVPDSILSAIENFNDFSLDNAYWKSIKDKIVNHIGYDVGGKMYSNITN